MRLQLSFGLLVVTSVIGGAGSAAAQSARWRLAADTLVYSDTDHVRAISPSVSARRTFEDEGAVGIRAAVDAVSAASVDVVSHATRGFEEVRAEGAVDAAVPVGEYLLRAALRVSWEPDYLSNGISLGLRTRLGSADTVLDASYRLSGDLVGRVGTPYASFAETLFTHGASLSLTQNLGTETVLRLVYAPTLQHGFLEKPYRYVPVFDASGQRLSFSAPEEVPDLRHGHAVGARLVQYLEPIDGSVRFDYQFYVGSWGVTGHVAELVGLASLTNDFRLGLRARFYGQTAASFWRREHHLDARGRLPALRSLDRDLSPYVSVTGAARVEWQVDDVGGYADGGVTFTHFDDFALLEERVAVVAQLGLRWTPR